MGKETSLGKIIDTLVGEGFVFCIRGKGVDLLDRRDILVFTFTDAVDKLAESADTEALPVGFPCGFGEVLNTVGKTTLMGSRRSGGGGW